MQQPPGLARLARRAFLQQEIRVADDLLPQVLLLRRGQEQRKLFSEVAIEGVFPQALDEGAEGQDVGRFPDREAARDLVGVEILL